MESTCGADVIRVAEMTEKDLEYFITLDENAAGQFVTLLL